MQVFYRNSQQSDFENAREDALTNVVTRMQAQIRRSLTQARYAVWQRIVGVVKAATALRTIDAIDVRHRVRLWTPPVRIVLLSIHSCIRQSGVVVVAAISDFVPPDGCHRV